MRNSYSYRVFSFFAIVLTVWAALAAHGQTNNSPFTVTAPKTNILQVLSAPQWLQSAFVSLADDAPYISNQVVMLEVGALYNNSLKEKFGAFADLRIPTSQQTSVGLASGYLDNQILFGSVTFQIGTTTTIPIVGQVYAFVEDGPAWDFKDKEAANYIFTGLEKKFDISKHWAATIGAGIGNISSIQGQEKALGGSVSYKW